MSDSHDNMPAIRRAVELIKDAGCDLLIHAGDFVAPFAAKELQKAGCRVKAVFGNCDGEKNGLAGAIEPFGMIQKAPLILNYNDINILVTHLDKPVKEYAAKQRYDVVIFGHTHMSEVRKTGKTLIINPGETGGWLAGKCTIALFDPKTGKIEVIPL